ncbi:YceI family protein [Actinomadura fulvescens]|uniref:YceI family protein n=1 Tax=Actinomadura fulvescens TaxID=46160 RepID=A0ABN3QF27_9ACTN
MSTMTTLGELTGDYVLDTARTRIGFVARHTVGGKVHGRFEEYEGDARLDGDEPSRSSVRLTIQAGSLRTGNRQRDEHLRGPFLRMADHPALTFVSTGMRRLDETSFAVTGDLSIRGVTRPVTVDVELTDAENDRVGLKGRATINRNDWGVNWNATTRLMVSAKVTLEVDVVAIRQADGGTARFGDGSS